MAGCLQPPLSVRAQPSDRLPAYFQCDQLSLHEGVCAAGLREELLGTLPHRIDGLRPAP